MDNTSASKTIHTVPKWNGKAKTFQLWWVCFMAFAMVQKFSKALGTTIESGGMPASEDAVIAEETDAGKLQLKAKNRNANAVAQFTMMFVSTETAMPFIYQGMVNND
jgi:hypothetical protein